MSYFSEWEQITSKVLELVRKNNELLQYICNPSEEPQSAPPPQWENIIMKNVFPVPKDPASIGEQKDFINVYISSSYPYEDNPFFRIDYLNIEVVCHLETWLVKGGRIRPYIICNLIDEMLNYKQHPELSIQKPMNYGAKVAKFGDMFYGYKMVYRLSNASAIECGARNE